MTPTPENKVVSELDKKHINEILDRYLREQDADCFYITKFGLEHTQIAIYEFVSELFNSHLSQMQKRMEEAELITKGTIEGAEQWKAEYDNCRKILEELVFLKNLKDGNIEAIKTLPDNIPYGQIYNQRKPLAWQAAKDFLKEYQHY